MKQSELYGWVHKLRPGQGLKVQLIDFIGAAKDGLMPDGTPWAPSEKNLAAYARKIEGDWDVVVTQDTATNDVILRKAGGCASAVSVIRPDREGRMTKAEESAAIKEHHLPIEIKRLQGEVATLKGAVDLYRETLRDRFAMAAVTGLTVSEGDIDEELCARFAYRMADAMMEARK